MCAVIVSFQVEIFCGFLDDSCFNSVWYEIIFFVNVFVHGTSCISREQLRTVMLRVCTCYNHVQANPTTEYILYMYICTWQVHEKT